MIHGGPIVRKWTKAEYHAAADRGWFFGQRVELIDGEVIEMFPTTATAEPTVRKWTKREYHEAAELGWFDGQRVELIDGEVVEMAAQRDAHAASLRLTDYAVRKVFPKDYVFCVQMPLNVAGQSEPEPDLAVVRGTPRSLKKHPTTAVLIVEISDTTLAYDRARKASLYASRGIRDYWIVNLIDRVVEVRRKAAVDREAAFGYSYAEATVYRPGETVTPLGARRGKVRVEDLLP
jgi:Uma2 family endonuclease